jgi:preprotein translocase subunit SecD
MFRKDLVVLTVILAVFAFAVCTLIYPLFGRQEMRLGLDLKGGLHLVYKADLSAVEPGEEAEVIDGVIAVIMNRINPLGVAEPIIEKQGEDRIVVELPAFGVTDVQKGRIGRTVLLEFRELVTLEGEEGEGEEVEEEWVPATAVIDGQEKVLTSSYLENAYVTYDTLSGTLLILEWNEEGAELFAGITSRLVGEPLGIFEGDEPLLGEDGTPYAPIVRQKIVGNAQIEGLSADDAAELASQLNAGRLPVPLEIIYDQTVSPSLGADFVDMSIMAGVIGIALVMLFMILYYRLPGFLASLSLVFYGALVMAIFKLIPVTLTLAGIGGFILSIGMAVDANVLIFERMKEELRAGQTLGAAVEAGFKRAWTAIRDSNITTFIVCIILIVVGSNIVAGAQVKGFGWTLLIGVAVSMFTAIVVTRTLLRLFVGTRLAKKLFLFSMHSGKE